MPDENKIVRSYIDQLTQILSERQKENISPDLVDQAINLVAELKSLGLDENTCLAAVLHLLTHDQPLQPLLVEKKLNSEISKLYQRITALNVISSFSESQQASNQLTVENLRRMLLAMVDDVRVVLVKLSHQLILLKSARNASEQYCITLARETLDVFAPLANRLGVWQLKWELEDFSLRYLNPDVYKNLARQLAERRVDREKYIQTFINNLSSELKEQTVDAQVFGRPKHIYSIWRKMQRKNISFDQIYDVRAIRILVNSITDCYTALGIVHTRWPNIASEFDDYIAVPKKNDYRSIHTAVVTDSGKVMEVQIRTHEMHRDNELGVAAHWKYKEGMADLGLDSKILWLRQLLEWKQEVASTSEIVNEFKTEVMDERVYVFTPKGQVVDLPIGATPLDFAYCVHTQVGHQCRGARVNGRIVTLNYKLQTAEQVEVLTVKKGGPSRDWLSHDNSYVMTHRARARIQRWFKEEDRDVNIAEGRQTLERELHRLAVSDVNYEKLAQSNQFKKVDDMLAAIGFGDIKISQIVSDLARPKRDNTRPKSVRREKPSKKSGKDDIQIEGVGNLLTQIARCCNPVPDDDIVGFITIGRGITIHRGDCGNILRLSQDSRDRLIQVDWGANTEDLYKTDLNIKAYNRPGLLNDITTVFADESINLARVNMVTDPKNNHARIELSIEIADVSLLSTALNKLSQINNVFDVQRVTKH